MTDKNQLNANGQKHDYWEVYWSNGNLCNRGNYINGKPDGYWEGYYSSGNPTYKGNYNNGQCSGYWEYYSNGCLNHKEYII